jgi:hypothetical protein
MVAGAYHGAGQFIHCSNRPDTSDARMPHPLPTVSGLLLLLLAPGGSGDAPARAADAGELAVQQRATIHVPRVTVTTTTIIMRSSRPAPAYREKKAEDCVKVERIAGFTVNRFDSVDLILRDGQLLRVKLGADCPALGFYSGFYVKQSGDRKICAKRDSFRSRSGRSCAVQGFTQLVQAR